MVIQAVLGRRPSVGTWAAQEDERRKRIMAKLREGCAAIVWDNVVAGSTLSCPVIEATLTSATFSDRILGLSETAEVPATAVHMFTGNNISPVGDLASRSLVCRLNVERPDPENRDFTHPDATAWTMQHRPEILAALYTLLAFNPFQAADPEARGQPKTRFKNWWSLVGVCVEEAAALLGQTIDFASMFQANEVADDAVSALARLLTNLNAQFGDRRFISRDICMLAAGGSDLDDEAGDDPEKRCDEIVADLAEATGCDFPRGGPDARRIGKSFQPLVDRPVRTDHGMMTLRRVGGHSANTYRVEVRK